jgi:hypothetical protein
VSQCERPRLESLLTWKLQIPNGKLLLRTSALYWIPTSPEVTGYKIIRIPHSGRVSIPRSHRSVLLKGSFNHTATEVGHMCLMSGTLTPWGGVPFETIIVSHLVSKIFAFYGTRRFITVFTRPRLWSLSWAGTIHSTPSHPISVRSILMLSSHLRLGLENGVYLSGFTIHILCFPSLPCVLHARPHQLPSVDHPSSF